MNARNPAIRRPTAPDFVIERRLMRRLGPEAAIIGVDEVGRGPLAGPVLAAAAHLTPRAAAELARLGLADSKTLTPKRRAALDAAMADLERGGGARIALGAASLREIERLNILWASHLAMRRAVAALGRTLEIPPAYALIDGDRTPAGLPCPAEALVKGDGRSLSIAAAALRAKRVRDRLMARLALRYPGYGWESNAGYGAAAHRAAIKAQGLTPHHRPGFCRRLLQQDREPDPKA